MKTRAAIIAVLSLFPAVAFAQTLDFVQQIIATLMGIAGMLVPIALGAAMVVFFWGLIQYLYKNNHEEGRKYIIWGLAALFVMVSVWGIIALAQNALDVHNPSAMPAPTLPTN